MHKVVWERLEQLLAGATEPLGSVESHLAGCAECRRELESYRGQALMLRSLRAPVQVGPQPGFYARVWEQIEARRRSSLWNALLDPGFGWRLALGSLAALLAMGAFLAVNEAGMAPPVEALPESVIAIEEHPPDLGLDPQRDREAVLVTLATYHE